MIISNLYQINEIVKSISVRLDQVVLNDRISGSVDFNNVMTNIDAAIEKLYALKAGIRSRAVAQVIYDEAKVGNGV